MHRKPILGIFAKVESGVDVGHLLTVLQKVVFRPLIRKYFNLLQDAAIDLQLLASKL